MGKWGKRDAFLIRKFWRCKQWYGNSLASLPGTQPSWLDSHGNMHMPIQTSKPHIHSQLVLVCTVLVAMGMVSTIWLYFTVNICLSVCLSVYLSIYLSTYMHVYDSCSRINCLLQFFSGSRPFHWRLWPFQSRQSSGQNPQLLECSLLPNHSAQSACNETRTAAFTLVACRQPSCSMLGNTVSTTLYVY